MAGAITAVKAATNDIVTFTRAAVTCTAGSASYLDVSTMDGSKVIFILNKADDTVAAGTITITDGANFTAGAVGNVLQATTAGDCVAVSTATCEYICGPFETARVKDSNGRINIIKSSVDVSVVSVRAILLP